MCNHPHTDTHQKNTISWGRRTAKGSKGSVAFSHVKGNEPRELWFVMDGDTTVEQLKKRVIEFRDARGWLKSDTPRSLAISVSVEAAELLEHFQWSNDEQTRTVIADPVKKGKMTDELADVLIYCLSFSDVLSIDVSEAVKRKLEKTGVKYPVVSKRIPA